MNFVIYNLHNLIKEPTCFKNLNNPSLIDLILTNRPNSFQISQVIQTGPFNHHKLTITVPKQDPKIIIYRDYKHFDVTLFRNELLEELNTVQIS